MLKIRLDIEKIDYEKCLETLLTQMVNDSRTKTRLTELDKLLIQLGDVAVPVTNKLLGYLDPDVRDQILVWLLDEYQDQIITEANSYLEKMFPGNAIVIGGLSAEDFPGPRITFSATQVRINFEQLISSTAFSDTNLGGAAKFALHMAGPETIEKQGINILSSGMIRPRFVSIISDSLHKAGLNITLRDIELKQDSPDQPPRPVPEYDGILPDSIEDPIIESIAAWLKSTVL